MSVSVQDIENAIMAKLASALPELSVEAFPERPEEYELLHPLGAVLVQYDGSSYSQNSVSNGAVAQVRKPKFSVVYLVRNLRDAAGCYDILDRGREALCGLCITGAITPMEITYEGFTAEHDGVWIYTQMYETSARSVHAPHK